MDAWFVAVRAIHFAACMLLAGELLFFAVIAGGAWRRNVAYGRALVVHVNVVAADKPSSQGAVEVQRRNDVEFRLANRPSIRLGIERVADCARERTNRP